MCSERLMEPRIRHCESNLQKGMGCDPGPGPWGGVEVAGLKCPLAPCVVSGPMPPLRAMHGTKPHYWLEWLCPQFLPLPGTTVFPIHSQLEVPAQ